MHEMPTVVTDVCGVCLSVCHGTKLSFTVFGVNTPDGPRNIVIDGGLDPCREGKRGIILNSGTPSYFQLTEARDLKFCVCIYRAGRPNKNYAKVGRRGSGVGSHDLILNFAAPDI